MTRFHINGKVVDTVDLLRKRHWPFPLRFKSWPFLILFSTWQIFIAPSLSYSDTFFIFCYTLDVFLIVYILTFCSVDFECFLLYSKVKDICHANACKITPSKSCGSKLLVPLHFREVAGSLTEEIYSEFRNQCFFYSYERKTFCKFPYPSEETFDYYLKSTGHDTRAKVQVAAEKWGRNLINYPHPKFLNLMKDRCLEHFFVYMVFSAGLGCLDELWQDGPIIVLIMLFVEPLVTMKVEDGVRA